MEYDWTFITDALHHYEAVAAALQSLADLFPFPGGGDPKDTQNIEKAVNLLQEAKRAEIDGLQALRHLREALGTLQAGGTQ
ncbi:hypothetical protein [Paenibacillus terrigena]|uniref:hypothetical protein n=1 Tax=Paenibacillus terrigena TaxID=369333 RepID=UPI0028D8B4D1|nr:hypothetical protein [Paenibacillus terrigena]